MPIELNNAKEIAKYLREEHGITIPFTQIKKWVVDYGFPAAIVLDKYFTTSERIDEWVGKMKDGVFLRALGYKNTQGKKITLEDNDIVENRVITPKGMIRLEEELDEVRIWLDPRNKAKVINKCQHLINKGLTLSETLKTIRVLYKAFRSDWLRY